MRLQGTTGQPAFRFTGAWRPFMPDPRRTPTCSVLSVAEHALHIPAQGLDWRDDKHWSCNDNVHPSRHGTYDGITMHPFETVFVKASWHVGEPFTSHYTRWYSGHALGQVPSLFLLAPNHFVCSHSIQSSGARLRLADETTQHFHRTLKCVSQDNTAGAFNEPMYRYGVSLEAQDPPDASKCYQVAT